MWPTYRRNVRIQTYVCILVNYEKIQKLAKWKNVNLLGISNVQSPLCGSAQGYLRCIYMALTCD